MCAGTYELRTRPTLPTCNCSTPVGHDWPIWLRRWYHIGIGLGFPVQLALTASAQVLVAHGHRLGRGGIVPICIKAGTGRLVDIIKASDDAVAVASGEGTVDFKAPLNLQSCGELKLLACGTAPLISRPILAAPVRPGSVQDATAVSGR